jgi:hypothetical protein
MWGVLLTILLAFVTALLWLSYGFASAYHLFGAMALPAVLHIAASAAAGLLFIVVLSQIVLRFGFATVLQIEPTGLHRGLVLAVLTFIATAAVLVHFGLDLGTVLTTSALITGIVGLSIQPMLASLISGLSVNNALRVGDGIVLGGETVTIVSLNWYAVIGRKANGSTVMIPNGKVTDGTLEIFQHNRPAQATVELAVPESVTPHRFVRIVNEITSDIAALDTGHSVHLQPVIPSAGGPMTYRISYWVRHYSERTAAGNLLLGRLWYALQRETRKSPADTPDLALPSSAKAMATGEVLTYGDGEPIVLPARVEGQKYLLIDGKLAEPMEGETFQRRPIPRAMALAAMERLLAAHIGPYAEYAVAQAAKPGRTVAEICEIIALEIDDEADRQAFLRGVDPPVERVHGPGFTFSSSSDVTERLVSVPSLRAVDHAVILAAPEAARRPHA